MEFKKCQVGVDVFGHLTDHDIHEGVKEYTGMIKSSVDRVRGLINANFATKTIGGNTRGGSPNANGEKLYNFFRLLSVCHTVVVDVDPMTNETTYQASSPDELALIQGAKQCGMVLCERSQNFIKVFNEITGEEEVYEILREFPFDSDRKRMTLIVRYQGAYLLLCKGADSIMLPRISQDGENQWAFPKITRELNDFAKEGLRTLVVCQKELS